jgi:isopenicillin-N N-acyltransferase-like protein
LLLKVRRKNGPDILTYTNPGLLACAGLNSKGISINWNTVPQREFAAGVPTYLIVAEVLKQPTIDDALHAVRRAHRAGYFNFVIADETELYNVEGTPKDLDISHSTDIIGHANHFASERFRSTQNVEVASCSLLRHDRINALLKENFGSIDLGKSMEFVRDHVNYPLSICRHPGDEPDPKERGLTLDSWISVPAKKELWICHGSPCENEFVRFGF